MKTNNGFRERLTESWNTKVEKAQAKQEINKKKLAEKEVELRAKIEAGKDAPKNKWELMGERVTEAGGKTRKVGGSVTRAGGSIHKAGNKLSRIVNKRIRKVVVPLLLFIIGLFTLPLGVLFWVLAIYINAKD